MEEIKEKLRAFIQEKFEIDDDPDFTDDVHLFNEGFVDSFGAVEIIHFIEQTYNIEITQKDITLYPMNTIEEIAEDIVENDLEFEFCQLGTTYTGITYQNCIGYGQYSEAIKSLADELEPKIEDDTWGFSICFIYT